MINLIPVGCSGVSWCVVRHVWFWFGSGLLGVRLASLRIGSVWSATVWLGVVRFGRVSCGVIWK